MPKRKEQNMYGLSKSANSAMPISMSVADFSRNGSPRQRQIADFTNSALPEFMDTERKRSQGPNQGQNVLDKQILKNDQNNRQIRSFSSPVPEVVSCSQWHYCRDGSCHLQRKVLSGEVG